MIKEYLINHREELLEAWKKQVFADYPGAASKFYKNMDEILNPVGATLSRSLEELYDLICGQGKSEKLPRVVDSLVRIRAVQELSASQAAGFMMVFRDLLRQNLPDDLLFSALPQYRELEKETDQISLMAFENFQQCREQLYNMKIKEIEEGTFANEEAGAACPSVLLDQWSAAK